MIDQKVSKNFQTVKILSIYMVVFGHYDTFFELTWVPVTIGLLIFAYSSGFFTAEKYLQGFNKKEFWLNKFLRIGKVLLFCDLFLLVLFIVQKKPDIIAWQSIVSCLGLTGLLNWFYIPNKTPFGAGLWFLTLLYIFYLCYPLILRLNDKAWKGFFFSVCYTFFMWMLELYKPYGHALWLTSCGFIWGVVLSRHKLYFNRLFYFIALVLIFSGMIFFNFIFVYKAFNFIFILFFAVVFMIILEHEKIPESIVKILSPLNGTIFFIYLLHPYLYLRIFDSNLKKTIFSMIFMTIVCKIFEIFVSKIKFNKKYA
ncbi:MAG: hypothetical protein CSB21_01700 [Deltaproteobacteria bacterium]|nr:MAG: hypothetical protein CSB21_01700 [Deltaproteobacteria bacterium]